jgi:phosphate transport system permease protein
MGDRFFGLVAVVSGLSVLAILVLIAYSTGREAWPIFSEKGAEFLFTSRWAPSENKFGALSFIFGTVVTSIIALVFAVPLSIGIALFINEVAPRRLKRPVISFLDLLAVVPSVVFGLWGILVLPIRSRRSTTVSATCSDRFRPSAPCSRGRPAAARSSPPV